MKQKLLIALIISGSLVLSPTMVRAQAAAGGGSDFWSDVYEFLGQVSELKELFEAIVSGFDDYKEITNIDMSSVKSTGVLNIPDLMKIHEDIQSQAADGSSNVDGYISEHVIREVDRKVTTARAETVLSEKGQEKMKEEIDATKSTIQAAKDAADIAYNETESQDIFKQMAIIQKHQTSILGGINLNQVEAKQRQELTNVQIANVSKTLDAQNKQKQEDGIGTGILGLQSSFIGGMGLY
jgi:uncharacterized protein (UPF0305 family)